MADSSLLQGTLELLVLKTLSLEPMHGWGIAQRIQEMSSEVFQVNQGSLYPALQRMKRKGWIRVAVDGEQPACALLHADLGGREAAGGRAGGVRAVGGRGLPGPRLGGRRGMSLYTDLKERLLAVLFRDREDRELEEELQFHLEMEEQANLRRGSGGGASPGRPHAGRRGADEGGGA